MRNAKKQKLYMQIICDVVAVSPFVDEQLTLCVQIKIIKIYKKKQKEKVPADR